MALFTGGGMHSARDTAELVLPAGIAWLALVHASLRIRRLGTFRLQYALAVASAVGVALIAVFWTADRMFVSDHDAGVLASLMLFAGVIGARIAMLLADRTAHDVERLAPASARSPPATSPIASSPSGPRELRDLADSANEMAAELERMRGRARRRRSRAAQPDRLGLARPADAADVAAPARRGDRGRRRRGPGRDRRCAAPRASSHVATLSTLVDDLFELARLEAGDISWTLSQVGVAELIDETVEAFRPQAEQKGLVLAESVPSDVVARARQPREAAARALQPRAERGAPHARRTAR